MRGIDCESFFVSKISAKLVLHLNFASKMAFQKRRRTARQSYSIGSQGQIPLEAREKTEKRHISATALANRAEKGRK